MYRDPFGREHRYGPPVGWTPKDGTFHFSAAEEWAAMCKRGLEFPEYRGPSSLRGVRGDCLEPLVTSKHMLRVRTVAPDEPLIDGALYVLELGESAQSAEAAAYREKHGIATGETFVITKFCRWLSTQWYAQCKDSICDLDEYGRVIAMVVAVLPLAGCEPEVAAHARQVSELADCNQAAANSMSQMVSNYRATTVTTTLNIGAHPVDTTIISASITTDGFPMAIDVGTSIAFTGGC